VRSRSPDEDRPGVGVVARFERHNLELIQRRREQERIYVVVEDEIRFDEHHVKAALG
jgi:hypothetical protein